MPSENSDHYKQSLSEILDSIIKQKPETYRALSELLQHHAMAIVLIMFAIPSALPVPAAGYSTILSIPLMCIGIRILMGHDTIWLPKKVEEKKFNSESFGKLITKAKPFINFVERFSKPRMTKLVKSSGTRTFIGILICLLALSMALPIPGTNTLPAGGIFLIGFSLLEDDGLLLIAGLLYSLVALCISVLVILFGYEVVKATLEFFKDSMLNF